MMNGLIFLLLLLAFESLFCDIMKKHDKARINKISNVREQLSVKRVNEKSRDAFNVKQLVLKALNDFTYFCLNFADIFRFTV